MSDKHIYKVVFINHGQVYEIYAGKIHQSNLYAFVEVEDFMFGEKSQLVLDPTEERLKAEFSGVKRSYIPMNSIIRIDEVEKEGTPKITETKTGANVTALPIAPPVPPKNS